MTSSTRNPTSTDNELEKTPKRATWGRTREFVLNVAGYNVGLGNVWRFSYLCYKNGGGNRLFFATAVCLLFGVFHIRYGLVRILLRPLLHLDNLTMDHVCHYVLQKTDGLGTVGYLKNWRMALSYFFSWVVCYLCTFKGVKTTGKVAYVTVTVPYVIMLVLMIKGLTLDGALSGITYYVTPDLARLAEPTVWLDAAAQVLYSLGVCYGGLYAFGSHNKVSTNCYRISFYCVAICCSSSIFFGFTIFSFIGHMASATGKNISEVVEGGPGLVFQVYPAAVALLPVPQLWSAMFFLALVFLAVDSQFGTLESCMSLLEDIRPGLFVGKMKYTSRTLLCFFIMLTGVPLLFDGGIYIFELLNSYGASGICIHWVAFFESVAVGWMYGVDRFYEDVKSMIGFYPHAYFKICYKYIAPFITMAIFVFLCAKYEPLTMGKYTYPWWGNAIGWLMSASVISCIPIVAFHYWIRGKGSCKQKRERPTKREVASPPMIELLPEEDKIDNS